MNEILKVLASCSKSPKNLKRVPPTFPLYIQKLFRDIFNDTPMTCILSKRDRKKAHSTERLLVGYYTWIGFVWVCQPIIISLRKKRNQSALTVCNIKDPYRIGTALGRHLTTSTTEVTFQQESFELSRHSKEHLYGQSEKQIK